MAALVRRRALLGVSVLLIALLAAACSLDTGGSTSSAPRANRALSEPSAAASFVVLGGPAVTFTDSVVNGDVGTLGAYTNTRSVINGTVHQGDQAAKDAYAVFVGEYAALAAVQTDPTNRLTGTLAGVTLAPGAYYFEAAATVTGVLTLDAQGDPNAQWIFKIGTLGTGALTGTGFSVVMANGGSPCNVYWWVAEAATMTASDFQGNILAGMAITVTGGAFNGNAWAKAAVTMTGVTATGCSDVSLPVPPIPVRLGAIKVTGGGQIAVPSPDSSGPDAIGAGTASFGFNAQPDKSGGAKGHFNYINHVTDLHINGEVDNIAVIDVYADNSPKTVLFSGTYDGGSLFVTVQDKGEPGTDDQFGILVNGSQSELRSTRVISNGNIQFHK